MREEIRITGSMVQAYMVCSRQTWLMSRQVYPGEDNIYLELGRLINEESYRRERKEIQLGHLKIDLIRKDTKQIIVGEIKKSSRAENAARLQLAFYLYELAEMGIDAEGELLYPEERHKEKVVLDEFLFKEVERVKIEIYKLILADKPPLPQWITSCGKCSYAELCWA